MASLFIESGRVGSCRLHACATEKDSHELSFLVNLTPGPSKDCSPFAPKWGRGWVSLPRKAGTGGSSEARSSREVLGGAGTQSPLHCERSSVPAASSQLSCLGRLHTSGGAQAGGLSLFIFPHPLVRPSRLHGIG